MGLLTYAVGSICRKGVSKSAKKMIEGAMRESGKLILVLDDDILCDMLMDKDKGKNPSDKLFTLTDNFLMSLNR